VLRLWQQPFGVPGSVTGTPLPPNNEANMQERTTMRWTDNIVFHARQPITFEAELARRQSAWLRYVEAFTAKNGRPLPRHRIPPRPVSPLTRHDEVSLAYARRHPRRWYRMMPEMLHLLASEVQP